VYLYIFTFLIVLKFHLHGQKKFLCSLTGSEEWQSKIDVCAIDFYLLHRISPAKGQVQALSTSLATSLTLEAIINLLACAVLCL